VTAATTAKPADAKLILPPCDFADDEELIAWLEVCRLTAIKAADEMEEDSGYVYAKLRRYAMYEGMRRGPAGRTARSVSLPLARAGDSLNNVAGYLRLSARRLEAYVEAVERPSVRQGPDFKVKNGGRRR
jgi:hypothetical protein